MSKRRILLASALAGLGIVLAWLLLRQSPALPPIQLLSTSQFPSQRVPLSWRIIPYGPHWAWAWRLREKLLGPFKPVLIHVSALRVVTSFSAWNFVWRDPDLVATNGLQVWELSADDLDALCGQLQQDPSVEFSYRGSLSMSEGTTATMLCGGRARFAPGVATQPGLRIEARPKLRGRVTDLTTSILWREPITNPPNAEAQATLPPFSLQTNLSIIGRFQLSNACGIFCLCPAAAPGEARFGVLLSATQGGAQGTRAQRVIRKR